MPEQAAWKAITIFFDRAAVSAWSAIFFLLCLYGPGPGHLAAAMEAGAEGQAAARFEDSRSCQNCHPKIYAQHAVSMHAKSVENPVFLAQYFKEALPRASQDPAFAEEAEGCLACHAPVAYLLGRKSLAPGEELTSPLWEVGCDFCHTITGLGEGEPGNANYRNTPGPFKFGPLQTKTNWHHKYALLQTKSQVCAVCHNIVNRNGLGVAATYDEWKASDYAARKIQCQDCHMSVNGFLTAGRPSYDKGKAASMVLGSAPDREKLYTHRFPGAHSKSEVRGAVGLAIEPGQKTETGLSVDILVNNSRTGHKMPSGSTQLRLMWLELSVARGSARLPVPAPFDREKNSGYDVTWEGPLDNELLGESLPRGARLYRAIFADSAGRQTLNAYDAVNIVFDNRLEASEIRKESYVVTIPAGPGEVTLEATLKYLPYPPGFARRLGLPDPAPVIIAAATRKIDIEPPAAPR